MRSRIHSLMVALGLVLVLTMVFSAALDLKSLLPFLLPVSGEIESAEAAELSPAHPMRMRMSLTKAPGQKAGLRASQAANDGDNSRRSAPAAEMLYGEEPPPPVIGSGVITPEPAAPEVPSRLVIPVIGLDAPILPAKTTLQTVRGEEYLQWQAPNKFAAGWHEDSALLGQIGNTVLNGHHNMYGKVFERLVDLNPGDLFVVFGTQKAFIYRVTNKMILPEKYQELDVRMDNARWILPSEDERLTLVTCWPANTNTHRLIIVASPLGGE